MRNVENKMQELQKDLLSVFEKHKLLVLKDSVMLEWSPIRIDVSSGLETRVITLSFREAIRLTNDELRVNIDKCGLVMDL